MNRLAGEISKAGLAAFYDRRSIEPGDLFIVKIYDAIRTARFGLVVITRHSVTSDWVRREWNEFLINADQRKEFRIIPLIKEAVAPRLPFQSHYQAIDFSDAHRYTQSLAQLLRALGA